MHRDIKTLNILITKNNQIRIADFGLSRFVNKDNSALTLTKLRGTYCYSAPELYFGVSYTVRADVYSLSIVLWEMITKTLTFKYMQPYSEYSFINFDFQIIIQVAKKGVRPTIPPQSPVEITELLQILWADSPDKRMTTEQLLSNLQTIEKHYEEHKNEWDALRGNSSLVLASDIPKSPNLPHLEIDTVPAVKIEVSARETKGHIKARPVSLKVSEEKKKEKQITSPRTKRENKSRSPKPETKNKET